MKLIDLNLTEEQEQRARRIHDESIIIDLLYQGPVSPTNYPKHVRDKVYEMNKRYGNDFIQSILRAGRETVMLAVKGEFPEFEQIWRESGVTSGNRMLIGSGTSIHRNIPLGLYDNALLLSMQYEAFDWMIKPRKAEDIRRAKREGKFAGIVTAHNTLEFGTDLELIEKFYDFGMRLVQLTENIQNFVGAGCNEPNDGGLSNFGIQFVKKLNELGIIVDTGHCGKRTTLDACKYSTAPVIISHSPVKSVYNHARGKDDETIKAVAATGGVIGVLLVPEYIGGTGEVTMEHFLNQVDYLVSLVGIEHVGIGTDYPLCQPDYAQEMMAAAMKATASLNFTSNDSDNSYPSTFYVKGFENYTDFINITRALVSRGYLDDDIRLILGGNWLRVFEKVCG